MSKTRKKYDREFKLMAVELSHKRTELVSLAKELDVRPELLYRWRKEFALKDAVSFPGNGKVLSPDVGDHNSNPNHKSTRCCAFSGQQPTAL